jgi:hypothetical protein
MRWTSNITDHWADVLRFFVRAVFILNGLMLAAFSVWFTARFLWRLHRYLGRVWFGHEW